MVKINKNLLNKNLSPDLVNECYELAEEIGREMHDIHIKNMIRILEILDIEPREMNINIKNLGAVFITDILYAFAGVDFDRNRLNDSIH